MERLKNVLLKELCVLKIQTRKRLKVLQNIFMETERCLADLMICTTRIKLLEKTILYLQTENCKHANRIHQLSRLHKTQLQRYEQNKPSKDTAQFLKMCNGFDNLQELLK